MNVSFPDLGIDMELNRVAFEVFGMQVYWYGIIIALGFIGGLVVAGYVAKKLGCDSEIALDLAIYCGPVAIICARLYYVLFKLDEYIREPSEILNFRAGGLAIYGGIIGGIVAAAVFCKVKKLSLLKIGDIGAAGIITGQMIGRWGNFFNQEAFGTNTHLPWGMTSENVVDYLESLKANGVNVNPDIPVHPTFLYESLWSLMTLVILLVIVRHHRYNGQVFFAYGALYGLGRFWIEGLRTDSLMMGPFRISQLVALLSVIGFGFLYFRYYKNSKTEKLMEN